MRILVVEDDPFMGQAVAHGLREENLTVTLAPDGLEALTALDICSLDAVILGRDDACFEWRRGSQTNS